MHEMPINTGVKVNGETIFITYRWLIVTAISAVASISGVFFLIVSLYWNSLQSSLSDIKAMTRDKVDIAVYQEHLVTTSDLKIQLAKKVDVDLFNSFCVNVNRIESNQNIMMQDIKELVKIQNRVVQKLDIR